MNDKTYNNLKPKQKEFIHLLADSTRMGSITPSSDVLLDTTDVLSRAILKGIANDNGIAWAPAWIVKDVSRGVARGMYRIPELTEYRRLVNAQEYDQNADDHCDHDVAAEFYDDFSDGTPPADPPADSEPVEDLVTA